MLNKNKWRSSLIYFNFFNFIIFIDLFVLNFLKNTICYSQDKRGALNLYSVEIYRYSQWRRKQIWKGGQDLSKVKILDKLNKKEKKVFGNG